MAHFLLQVMDNAAAKAAAASLNLDLVEFSAQSDVPVVRYTMLAEPFHTIWCSSAVSSSHSSDGSTSLDTEQH